MGDELFVGNMNLSFKFDYPPQKETISDFLTDGQEQWRGRAFRLLSFSSFSFHQKEWLPETVLRFLMS